MLTRKEEFINLFAMCFCARVCLCVCVCLCVQVRRPLPLAVPLSVLLDAQVLGVEMPQERLIRSILADFEGWQVCACVYTYLLCVS